MQWVYVLAALLCTVLSAVPSGELIGVWFRSKNGNVYGKEYYSLDRAIFRVSERMRTDIKWNTGENESHIEMERIQVEVECEPKTFYIVARLLEQFVLDIEIDADDVIKALRLSAHLAIADGQEKKAFYRFLAKATTNDASFRRKIEGYKDIPGIKLYMLQLLREYMDLFCIKVRVRRNKATLHHAREKTYSSYGSVDELGEVADIKVLRGAMSSIVSQNAMYMLRWFIDTMDICGLCMFLCTLNLDAMACIGSMKGLTILDLQSCDISGGGIKYIQALNNLRELCVTDHTLCSDELSAIGKMKNITSLKLNCCRIEQGSLCNIKKLDALTELELSWKELSENDFAEIGKIKSLTKLDIHNCKVEPGFLKHIKGMNNLKILNIYGLEGHGKEQRINKRLQKLANIKILGILRLKRMPLSREDRGILRELCQRNVHVEY